MAAASVTSVDLTGLKKIGQGKVRDVFEVDDKTLLFVASDRVSAFDVVMKNGIPDKGAILTHASAHWFKVLSDRVPGLKTHFLTLDPPAGLPAADAALIKNRSMQVRRLKVIPLEAIVRGYITGSAWSEYKAKGTVHGIRVPEGMQQSQAFETPLYTPSTKAEQGEHDENIHPDEAARIVGDAALAKRVEELALALYSAARDYARERGIILADTKFEFGVDPATGDVVLVDEVLTPDSSRYWPAEGYAVGRDQESFDKQFIRNWLIEHGLKGKEGVELPEDVCRATADKYKDVFLKLVGKSFDDVVAQP
ncbi:saicar synthetase [Colletotrichum graminicola]|uniref:Phosphoribosylaminoimidazole-succinocarboxamide synthase n=1 Tax=Colletotrichum graminicola (strain M1.001 / M2 / FGSC 10212) TaxID=645133 RepID=E3QP87_COLGM|nr:saicar synthetase [Colletotrichum graminicola M1.001]EFQ32675.1 saicar synthetase [Colletotrichum graminicola M1.001]WDK18118.1 saicar synthetase [Colletotrichum graminicola]